MNGPNFKVRDCQQIGPASARIVKMLPAGPHWVRIHESLESHFTTEPSRYFLSVDLKFRTHDALREIGWYGMTKAEATKEAAGLADSISKTIQAIEATEKTKIKGWEYLLQRHEQRLSRLLSRYAATVE